MIRSHFAIARLLVLPYGVLLALYLVVVGGGGVGLYLQVRAVETRLLVDEIDMLTEPLRARLRTVDSVASMKKPGAGLLGDFQRLFTDLPALQRITVRDRQGGFELENGFTQVSLRPASPLPEDAKPLAAEPPPGRRLYSESGSEFRMGYDLVPATEPPAQLALTFDRAALLARIETGLASIEWAIRLFALVGALSICAALIITVVAMQRTQRIEAYFQEVYRRASIADLAAELVHDLRNPLMAFRANVTALKIAPARASEVVADMDRDIAVIADKLNGFLKLTRRGSDDFSPADIDALLREAARLAGPVLAQRGLGLELDSVTAIPQAIVQKDALRDALVNVLVNAAESGQTEGVIKVTTRVCEGWLQITVEDRGHGIAAQHAPRVFDAFYTTKQEGNGLGLAIVKRVVADHGGRVSAENRAGGGARILITLPLQPKEVPGWWKTLSRHHPI